MSALYLIRHGATEANERRLYCGSTDVPLSEKGRAELRALRESGGYPDAAGLKIFTSGMLRAEQTLEILFGKVPHAALPGLREMSFGVFEMQSYEELVSREDYIKWISGDNRANRAPGGESGIDMDARVAEALGELLASGDALAVLHGGPVASIMARLFPEEAKNRFEWQPKNGRGYRIDTAARTYSPIPREKES